MGELSLHLTNPNSELAQWQRNTPAGMAHWAGTGPAGRTCRECEHFDHNKEYYSRRGIRGATLKPARCKQYTKMMNGEQGAKFAHETRACKYFTEVMFIPPIEAPR